MIRYKINLLLALKNVGYNTNKIRKEKIFTEAQLQQMRDNKLLTQKALNKVCNLLECQPGDILEYIPDEINQIQKKVES
ncbi:MAG: helix-turn-helix domain-containing protein [Lachnospiraceae bacterium]|nr:helix-turn-helix domain-containing protein [Lachnospiraceae bacterium]